MLASPPEADLVVQLDDVIARLRALDPMDLATAGESAEGQSTVLQVLERVGVASRLIDSIGVVAAGVTERSSQAPVSMPLRWGEKNAAALVAAVARVESSAAHAWCAVGDRILPRVSLLGERLPADNAAVGEAMAQGRISVAAARMVTDSLHLLRADVDATMLGSLEAQLVEHAQNFSTRELGRLCRQLPDMFTPDDAELREQRLRAKAGLTISRTSDGLSKWVLLLDPEAEGFLKTALDARTSPRRQPTFTDGHGGDESNEDLFGELDDRLPAEADTRTLAQQRLDALVSIARESLERDPGQVGGTAVTMMVTVALETLQTGVGIAQIEGVDEPISAGTARRLAAQAEIIPVVLGTDSQPLDLGRSARLFTEAQRRFIAVRDGGCLWSKCTAPPGWCEIAHIIAWILHGDTDVDNGIMLCAYHHRRFDNDGWTFRWIQGEPHFIPPPWIDPARTPRRGGRAPKLLVA